VELKNGPGVVHIVDDDASFLKAMERRLKQAGYEVATYASAQHLLDHLSFGLPLSGSHSCLFCRSCAVRPSVKDLLTDSAHGKPAWG